MDAVPVVAIVHLGSPGSMGGRRRVASLSAIFTAAGARVTEVRLLADHRARPGDVMGLGLLDVVRGRTVPERMAWSRRSVRARIVALAPDVVVCVTARAFDPDLAAGPWTVVVDFVDRLSDSYRDRARILGRSPTSAALRVLAVAAARFERRPLPAGCVGIAAGADDASALGLDWVPNTVELSPVTRVAEPAHDVMFLGKLSYAPNVEAIERLGRVWPAVQAARPGTTFLLAGAAPSDAVRALAQQQGWTLAADFDDLEAVVTSARIATAPLGHASGIQSKVLETAAFGLPQVISTAVAKGFGPGMPALVIETDAELVDALTSLLDDPAEQARLGREGRAHLAQEYGVQRWTRWAEGVLKSTTCRG